MEKVKDAIWLSNYVFYYFNQSGPSTVSCNVFKIGGDFDEKEVKGIINNIGLWEDYVAIKNTLKEEISEGVNSNPIVISHSENKYKIEHYLTGYNDSDAIAITLSDDQRANRRIKKEKFTVKKEEVIDGLINVKKWLMLKKINNKLNKI